MKDNNRETIIHFEMSNQEYAPVKNAISEELKTVISKVYQLDHETGWTLHYLTEIMLNHFHEDVARVQYGDLTPIECSLNSIASRVEKVRIELLKAGYEDKIEVGNPMWYLKLALQDFEQMKKEMKKCKK
ncbi:hypothetical protein J8K62_01810 [Streptococcus suis]|uniref:Uncharacterized protein n=5 Tax=Streptococcus suis TaxID=1307 RepID=A0A116R7S1_STRSU|nr:hypothetical protein [Streptococcus suis]QBX11487.1 hypothetical protein JavanS581_0011 [Streptococcus satellite phage Javan581]AEB82419.1 hypothetical protein SSUST3_2010 [Streptococcus suis ST3]ALA29775.1 hypothetical protein AA105_11290 [Streptococcus suis]AMU79612.1 hypothetical protein AN924_11520 [Streptococcus suis]AUW26845.1 hypothetical protein CR542_10325 [Streptococcus suis]